jgi:hypothetical protein
MGFEYAMAHLSAALTPSATEQELQRLDTDVSLTVPKRSER